MGYSAAADVPFDFEGVLSLCRQLWDLAAEVDGLKTTRSDAAATALTRWEGAFAVEFAARADDEGASASQIAAGLRGDAMGWAAAWESAMDENNRRRWARHHKKWKDDQSVLDDLLGSEDHTPQPDPVGQPQAPGFAATGFLVTY